MSLTLGFDWPLNREFKAFSMRTFFLIASRLEFPVRAFRNVAEIDSTKLRNCLVVTIFLADRTFLTSYWPRSKNDEHVSKTSCELFQEKNKLSRSFNSCSSRPSLEQQMNIKAASKNTSP